MPTHSLRTRLAFVLLISLVLLTRVSLVRATSNARSQGRSFQPSGYGTAAPQRVSAATAPRGRDAGSQRVVFHPSQSTSGGLSAPQQTVVSVPPPTGTNPSAHEGIADNGPSPTDANGAGGQFNYIEAVNRQFAIYDRNGTQQYTNTFQAWFGSLAGGATMFYDPNVVYDQWGKRFIFVVDTGKLLLLSVAQQTNVNAGSFCNYSLPALSGWGLDFDKLGVSSVGIYLSANLVAGPNVSNELFFANRTTLENCGTLSYIQWSKLTNPDGSIAQAIVPAVQDTGSSGVEYLVNSHPSGGCDLTLWTLLNNAKLSSSAVPTQCYSPPPNAPQKGSSATIYPGDCSLSHVSYVGGLLTLTITGSHDWGDGNGPVGIVEWFVLNPSTASVSSQGEFGIQGYWLLYPAVVRNYAGNMLFVYDASSSAIYPSIWLVHYVNQTFTGSQALAQGVSSFGTSGGQPWGDYHSAWLDDKSVRPNSVWITGMYANAANSWGTKFGLVLP